MGAGMTRYIRSTIADVRRMAADAHRAKRIALGRDPDVAEDGTPYVPCLSGQIVEGLREVRPPSGDDEGEYELTGRSVWIPERDSDARPEDAEKEIQERDLGDEFKHLRDRGVTSTIPDRQPEGGR